MSHTWHRPLRWILSLLVVGLVLCGVLLVLGGIPLWQWQGSEVLQQRPLWGVLLVLGVFLVGLWGLPKWHVAGIADASTRLALETEVRKTLTLILGGSLGLAGLYLIWGTLQETRRLLEVGQYNQPVEREARLSERLARAMEQLGAMHMGGHGKHLEVRLSGIYALERIAHEAPQEYRTVMDILTAYARANPSSSPTPPVDLEAVFAVLKRRGQASGHSEAAPLNLRAVGFRGASLEEINLSGVLLTQADLREANLTQANLRQANLVDARLGKATLTGANLTGADLRGVDLQEANLHGADLTGANLQGANLSGVDLTQTILDGVSFKEARLHAAVLRGLDLRGLALDGATLHAADLRDANLTGAHLAGNSLAGAILAGASCAEADLHAANLLKADISHADLRHANLRGANLQEANLANASLQDADLRDATLVDVKNLSQEQFNQACTDDRRPRWPFNLTWPSGLKPSASLPETCQRWEAKP